MGIRFLTAESRGNRVFTYDGTVFFQRSITSWIVWQKIYQTQNS